MVSFVTHWFTPHYTNNHRPKLLQPAGLSVLVAIFLLTQSTLSLFKLTDLPGGFVLGYASSITPAEVVEMTNLERSKAGLSPLSINERLNEAALAKATHMFQNDYWAHVAPDGTTPWVFIKNAGYGYSVAGENLARDFGDTASMVHAWMGSPTHKENIVHKKYTQIGIAVVNGKLQGVDTTLVVQMFGTPVNIAAQTLPKAATTQPAVAPAPPPPPVVEISQLQLANAQISAPTLGTQTTKRVSPLTVTKVAASALILLLVLVLAYDGLAANKHNLPRKVGNNWAHLAFLGIVLVIIMAMTEGSVL